MKYCYQSEEMIVLNAYRGGAIMASVTVRNLPDETHRALRVRAAQNGRSTEAEIREILEEAVRPQKRLKLGSALAALGDKYNLDLQIIRDQEPGRIVTFE
jgi:plasmid stability protein